MTRVAYVADVHLGNHARFGGAMVAGLNDRCQRTLDVFKRSLALAAEKNCTTFVVLGDLFDSHKPTPQLIAATQKIVWEAATFDDLDVYILKGNHEMVTGAKGDHSLGPLGVEGAATVWEEPTIVPLDGGTELWAVPFQAGVARTWLPGVLQRLTKHSCSGTSPAPRSRMLLLHLGIEDSVKTPTWLKGAHDSIHCDLLLELMAKHQIAWTCAGNWHDHKLIKSDAGGILQVGALVPTGFNNPGWDYGYVGIHDSDAPEIVEVHQLPGPRFIQDCVENAERQKAKRAAGCAVYLESKVPPDAFDIERERLEARLSDGTFVRGVVRPNGAIAAESARQAATAARSSETLGEAVAAYCEAMALPSGVDRGAVTARVRKYLEI